MRPFTILLTVALMFLVGGCGHDTDRMGGSGLIETDEVITGAETSGRVLALYAVEGGTVARGDTLAMIDPSRIELELASARAGRKVLTANLKTARLTIEQATVSETYAKSELARITRLLSAGTATQKQHDAVQFEHNQASIAAATARSSASSLEAQIEKADADIARLQRQLADCYPTAGLTGTVVETYVDPGELLSPGRAIAKLARLDTVWVKVYLPAGQFARVKLGDKASVDTEIEGGQYEGTVVWTSSEAEFTPKNVQTEQSRADLVYAVKVRIPNADRTLKIGMPLYVSLEQ